MRFVSAVALAAVMLWVPVDGVAQTQAEREMLQLYESRERQLLASISPEYDESQAQSSLLVCVGAAMSGNPRMRNAAMQDCTRQVGELRNQQAARRRPLEQELFALRQDKLELERRIRLARASTNSTQRKPEDRPPVTASAGATVACSESAEELDYLNSRVEQGDAAAQAELGFFYASGTCVPRNYVGAVRLWRLAAEQGNGYAQYSLGLMYSNGNGVPEDDVEAVRWIRLAAEQGYAEAQYKRGLMYDTGEGVPENAVEGVRWYRLAAEQGYAYAQHNLGFGYSHGRGVPENDVLAYMWYNLAAALFASDEDAQRSQQGKDFVEQRMTREQVAEAQRMSREWLEAHPSGN